jgi:hypothetical protein
MLSQRSNLQEVLWNFSRYEGDKCLTLNQNPHFYRLSDLPISPEAYVGDFKANPIASDYFQHAEICVLTDRPGLVTLETDQGTQVFGNVWAPTDALIFKGSRIALSSSLFFHEALLDLSGKVVGESIIQAFIQGTPELWYLELEGSLLSPTSPAVSPNMRTLSPTIVDGPFRDWREPIRRGLISPHTDIRIRALSPIKPSPGSPASPSLAPSGGSNGRDRSHLSMSRIPA